MALLQFCRANLLKLLPGSTARSISTTSVRNIKEIKVNQIGETLDISAEYTPSPREPLLLKEVKNPVKKFCPQCTLGLDIKHTDVLILSQYLRSDGCILPRRVTGLCGVQQKKIATMIRMSQKAGLMPNIGPAWSKKDPQKRYQWKKYNKYFDEYTIRYKNRFINIRPPEAVPLKYPLKKIIGPQRH